jgi:methionyl-tRNA formyltransferase
MKIIFFGTPDFAVPTLQQLLNTSSIEVLGVVTQPDRRRGRGSQLSPSPIKTLALEHQLPVWQPEKIKKDAVAIEQLKVLNADVFVVIAYGQILSQEILDLPKLGCINVHGSLLPKYRGAAPIQWCLYNGEKVTGITTMMMDAGMDTGAMLLKKSIEISLETNAPELAIDLANLGAELLLETLANLSTITPIPQDTEAATYAPLIKKENYLLDWQRKAIDLHNQIRGFAPHCYTTYQGQPLKITASLPLDPEYFPHLSLESQSLHRLLSGVEGQNVQQLLTSNTSDAPPGTAIALPKNRGIVIQTGSGLLLVTKVQPPGKGIQAAGDFANGNRLQVGIKLGD